MLEAKNAVGAALSEASMSTIAELLERKQTLLERMQKQPAPNERSEIERHLDEINDELNRIEADDLKAPIAPQ